MKYVSAFGIDRITNRISPIHKESVSRVFPEVTMDQISRPLDEVELSVGYDYAGWHPTKELSNDHLLLLSNQFGKCFGGSHTSVNKRIQKYVNNASVVHFLYKTGVLTDFFSIESMGVKCDPKCGKCSCRKSPVSGKSFTLKEERELYQIEAGLQFYSDHWVATYLWKKDPKLLPNN